MNLLYLFFCRIVVCNLYPFVKTVSREECTVENAVEEIDIGNLNNQMFANCIPVISMLCNFLNQNSFEESARLLSIMLYMKGVKKPT